MQYFFLIFSFPSSVKNKKTKKHKYTPLPPPPKKTNKLTYTNSQIQITNTQTQIRKFTSNSQTNLHSFYSDVVVATCAQCVCTFLFLFACLSLLYVPFYVTVLLFIVANRFQE